MVESSMRYARIHPRASSSTASKTMPIGSSADALRLISLRLHTVAAADDAVKCAEVTHVERIGRVGVVYRIAVAECTGLYSTGGDR